MRYLIACMHSLEVKIKRCIQCPRLYSSVALKWTTCKQADVGWISINYIFRGKIYTICFLQNDSTISSLTYSSHRPQKLQFLRVFFSRYVFVVKSDTGSQEGSRLLDETPREFPNLLQLILSNIRGQSWQLRDLIRTDKQIANRYLMP